MCMWKYEGKNVRNDSLNDALDAGRSDSKTVTGQCAYHSLRDALAAMLRCNIHVSKSDGARSYSPKDGVSYNSFLCSV